MINNARAKGGRPLQTQPHRQKSPRDAGATLRSRTARSQDESPCGAIHEFTGHCNVNYARLKGSRLLPFDLAPWELRMNRPPRRAIHKFKDRVQRAECGVMVKCSAVFNWN